MPILAKCPENLQVYAQIILSELVTYLIVLLGWAYEDMQDSTPLETMWTKQCEVGGPALDRVAYTYVALCTP